MTVARNTKIFFAPHPDMFPCIDVCWFLTNLALNLQLCVEIYVLHEGTIRLFSAGN